MWEESSHFYHIEDSNQSIHIRSLIHVLDLYQFQVWINLYVLLQESGFKVIWKRSKLRSPNFGWAFSIHSICNNQALNCMFWVGSSRHINLNVSEYMAVPGPWLQSLVYRSRCRGALCCGGRWKLQIHRNVERSISNIGRLYCYGYTFVDALCCAQIRKDQRQAGVGGGSVVVTSPT